MKDAIRTPLSFACLILLAGTSLQGQQTSNPVPKNSSIPDMINHAGEALLADNLIAKPARLGNQGEDAVHDRDLVFLVPLKMPLSDPVYIGIYINQSSENTDEESGLSGAEALSIGQPWQITVKWILPPERLWMKEYSDVRESIKYWAEQIGYPTISFGE